MAPSRRENIGQTYFGKKAENKGGRLFPIVAGRVPYGGMKIERWALPAAPPRSKAITHFGAGTIRPAAHFNL
jgi:hypothetical protein